MNGICMMVLRLRFRSRYWYIYQQKVFPYAYRIEVYIAHDFMLTFNLEVSHLHGGNCRPRVASSP